ALASAGGPADLAGDLDGRGGRVERLELTPERLGGQRLVVAEGEGGVVVEVPGVTDADLTVRQQPAQDQSVSRPLHDVQLGAGQWASRAVDERLPVAKLRHEGRDFRSDRGDNRPPLAADRRGCLANLS